MITAVDSSVLIDIFLADPEFGAPSRKALATAQQHGSTCLLYTSPSPRDS